MKYIHEYTVPNKQVVRQLHYKRLFKSYFPQWDDTLILATRLLREQFHTGKISVLDFGCGNGNWIVDELKNRISFAVGLDIDKQSTQRNTSVDKIIIGNLNHPYFKGKKFDTVITLWTLEHIENPDTLFFQFNKVLKKNGIVVIVTPNKNSFLVWVRIFFSVVNKKFGDFLVSRLYGRNINEIFKTYYNVNTPKRIAHVAKKYGFTTKHLVTNFDPSYLSFDRSTFLLNCAAYLTDLNLFKPHIVTVMKKKTSVNPNEII